MQSLAPPLVCGKVPGRHRGSTVLEEADLLALIQQADEVRHAVLEAQGVVTEWLALGRLRVAGSRWYIAAWPEWESQRWEM